MTKRIAIFSDVHGNVHAFQAMYQDAIQQGIDESWFVGDLLMPGPGINSIWQIFKKLQPTVIVCGNWDDLTVRGARGQMDLTVHRMCILHASLNILVRELTLL